MFNMILINLLNPVSYVLEMPTWFSNQHATAPTNFVCQSACAPIFERDSCMKTNCLAAIKQNVLRLGW